MKYTDIITPEFDESKRILHLTATEQIRVSSESDLTALCMSVQQVILKYASPVNRCYMVVNLSKFVIDPSLYDAYSEKIRYMQDEFIHPGGLLRYGYQITRVTIQLANQDQALADPTLFANLSDAYAHIDRMEKSRKQASKITS